MKFPVLACLTLVLLGATHRTSLAAEPPAGRVDFNRDIAPVLSRTCFACHGPDEEHRKGGLRLDKREPALEELSSGMTAIVPGKIDESELYARITATDAEERMPPKDSGHTLTPAQIELFKRWIAEGANYAEHWSYTKPVRPALPEVRDKAWPRNGIDHFVQARLEAAGLKPSPAADKYLLIRRLSLDLRGLPPSPQEVEQFVKDESADAYEKLVDRMLNDPAFGERWARMWLDQARYADSMGYGSDPLRTTIWRYRDWVIDAFNRNLPYDQFTIEQLAGDLLPDATLEQRVATAFHRNTMTNTEGGTDDEEFRVAAIKDRVDTTMQVWMGLTFGCAKCHNHKYEPVTQKEYYQFLAFFNQTADADLGDEAPLLSAPTTQSLEETQRIDAQLAELKRQFEAPTPELAAAQTAWEAELRGQPEWTVLKPVETRSAGGATLQTAADGAILATGTNPAQETYTVTARTDLEGITALRLETLPDPSLPGAGAGRAADGNFVLSRFSVTAEDEARAGQQPLGRYVRIELPGAGKLLSLAEVQVTSGGKNVATAGKASQSSTDYDGPAQLAIDGNTNGHFFEAKSTTHTRSEDNPWWELDLGSDQAIEQIMVWNRTDGNVGSRLANFRVTVLDAARKSVWSETIREAPAPSRQLSPSGKRSIALAQAAADFSQDAFPVANSLTQKDLTQSGWAVSPKTNEPHTAVFVAGEPLSGEKSLLTFTLEHRFKDPGYNLGRFRLSATSDKNVLRRLGIPAEVLAILDKPAAERTAAQTAQVAAHYRSIAPGLQPLRDQMAALEKSRPAAPAVPVMQELTAERRRKTHIMVKGNFLNPGDEVGPATPEVFHSLPAAAAPDRLAVARWLVDDENPLSARVAVNRFWAQIFGVGLVETEEDFGTQGDLPSHPELLDWLAVEFRQPSAAPAGSGGETRWDVKAFLKLVVTSATYRQLPRVTPELIEKDPRNRLLSRGPRFRLEAEMVRDQALALSGLLSRKTHGPSVYPFQPPGLWQAAFNGQRTWSTSEGEDKYRRGLYTFWRRTIPYPSMATFDAPSREICAVRRIRTNTPLQAFVTLNDPVYVEAAQALARRIAKEGGASPESRAAYGLQLCLARPAHASQVKEIVALYQDELAYYQQHPEAAAELATDPLGPLPAGASAPELAAWTVAANVLLNLDGVLTK